MGSRRRAAARPWGRWAGLLGGALLLLASCASPTTGSLYVHPNADLSFYERVAVMPLENLTSDRFASERVREILSVELASLGLFEVVEAGEVNRVLRAENVLSVGALGPEALAELGRQLKVKALLMGSVMESRERRTGNLTSYEVALSLKMVDVESGISVWSISDVRSGVSLWTRLFGVGERTQTEVIAELVRQLLNDVAAAVGA